MADIFYVFRYDPNKYSIDEASELAHKMMQSSNLNQIIVIPDDTGFEIMSRKDLLKLREKISEVLHNSNYKKKC